MSNSTETAVFGGGCFWCTEAVFLELKGVMSVTSGYAGGKTEKPRYETVSSGDTGHAEVIRIEFDPNVISYSQLLEVFFMSHNPTTLNRQGNDVGDQYRSMILYMTDEQKREAERYVEQLILSGAYKEKIVTEVLPLDTFYPAEEYHQKFYKRNSSQPYCQVVITPKIEKLKEKHGNLLKQE